MTHAVDLDREQGPPRSSKQIAASRNLLGFVEDVFVVLGVALADHGFEFVISGVDSDKRDGGVVVFLGGSRRFSIHLRSQECVALSLVITLS